MSSREELIELYWVEGLKQSEIAEKIGVNPNTVWRRLERWGIPSKSNYFQLLPLEKR